MKVITMSWSNEKHTDENTVTVKKGEHYECIDENTGWSLIECDNKEKWIPTYCFDTAYCKEYQLLYDADTDKKEYVDGVTGETFYEIDQVDGWSYGWVLSREHIVGEIPSIYLENGPIYTTNRLLKYAKSVNRKFLTTHNLMKGMKYYLEMYLSDEDKIDFSLMTDKSRAKKVLNDFVAVNYEVDSTAIDRLEKLLFTAEKYIYSVVDTGFNIGKAYNKSAIVMARISQSKWRE